MVKDMPNKFSEVTPEIEELAKKWLANGAQPTETVNRIFKATGIVK